MATFYHDVVSQSRREPGLVGIGSAPYAGNEPRQKLADPLVFQWSHAAPAARRARWSASARRGGRRGFPAPGTATGQTRPVLLLGCSVLAGAAFRFSTIGV